MADEAWEELVIEERSDPDRTVLSLSFVKKVTKQTQEKYEAILNAMQPDQWYKESDLKKL